MAMDKKVLITVIHGTYGHQDDSYGALLLGSGILAKGGSTTLYLKADGVFLVVAGQNPNALGFPNNLDELGDFLDLGGVVKVDRTSMDERGLRSEDLIDNVEVVEREGELELISEHHLNVIF